MSFIRGFTRSDLAIFCDALQIAAPTPKQLQYWADEKNQLIQAHFVERLAFYTFSTVLDILLLAQLVEQDIPLQRVRKVIKRLESDFGWGGKDCIEPGKIHLLTDGKEVYALGSLDDLAERLNGRIFWKAFAVNPGAIQEAAAKVVVDNNWRDRLSAAEVRYLACAPKPAQLKGQVS